MPMRIERVPSTRHESCGGRGQGLKKRPNARKAVCAAQKLACGLAALWKTGLPSARAQPVVAWCKGRAGGVDEKGEGLVLVLHAKKEPQKVRAGPTYFGRSRSQSKEFWSRSFATRDAQTGRQLFGIEGRASETLRWRVGGWKGVLRWCALFQRQGIFDRGKRRPRRTTFFFWASLICFGPHTQGKQGLVSACVRAAELKVPCTTTPK
jgi:hypothetical protein